LGREAEHPPKELLKLPNWSFAENATYVHSGFYKKWGNCSVLLFGIQPSQQEALLTNSIYYLTVTQRMKTQFCEKYSPKK
jgi:hypothetical protein